MLDVPDCIGQLGRECFRNHTGGKWGRCASQKADGMQVSNDRLSCEDPPGFGTFLEDKTPSYCKIDCTQEEKGIAFVSQWPPTSVQFP